MTNVWLRCRFLWLTLGSSWCRNQPVEQQEICIRKTKVPELLAQLKLSSNTKNLRRGKEVHEEAIRSGSDSCILIATALVNMYAKCGAMVDARQVFDRIKQPDVVSWTALILGYSENGDGITALDLFARMRCEGLQPDSITFIAALKACTSLALKQDIPGKAVYLEIGRQFHTEIGNYPQIYSGRKVQGILIDMYAKCGSMVDARKVFDSMRYPDMVSWNTLILGYAENREGLTALSLFARMKYQGFVPNSITFVAALKACASLAASRHFKCLELGKEIHSQISDDSDIYVQNMLVDMYSKCRSMVDARQVFNHLKCRDVVSWNALILGYAENGEGLTALDLFEQMKSEGYKPDCVTFLAAIKACSSFAQEQHGSAKAECLERGKMIHLQIPCHFDGYVQNALIDMYAKCGSMIDARHVFENIKLPNLVSWNALILGYAENGESYTAFDVFAKMRSGGCVPNSITFRAALKACIGLSQDGNGKAECVLRGRYIHSEITCFLDIELQNSLIYMYASCGSMVEAQHVFDSLKHPDVVSWNTLISGYAENGQSLVALELFARMRSQGCAPEGITFVAVLKACSLLGALEFGRNIHIEILHIIEDNPVLVTCLVDFYAKCGSLVESQRVFDYYHRIRDVRMWTALLAGYSRLGDDQTVFALFKKMQDTGFRPDGVTFLCILTSCCHSGLVEKANGFFEAMSTNYGIHPNVEHYTCMVDMLGRTKKLDDAMVLVRTMPSRPCVPMWMAVLAACGKLKNAGIGSLAFKTLVVSLEDTNAAAYVLMAHIYGSRGMWEEQSLVLGMRKQRNTLN